MIFSFKVSAGTAVQETDSAFIAAHYEKIIFDIPMRDGVKLHTQVYLPKDTSKQYPMLMQRTCYSIRPYGEGNMPTKLGPSSYLMRDLYIFVYQDVRGRYMSEGKFDNMRPIVDSKSDPKATDESTDTYDTIDYLLKQLEGRHNGNIGTWGISYPGHYSAVSNVKAHPALKAASPQAPIADFYFDDFHHRGAYTLSYWFATPVFGYQKDSKTTEAWYRDKMAMPQKDKSAYDFFLELGPLKNTDQYYKQDNFFWQELSDHPNYDQFWQKRNLLPHLNDIDHAVLVVGGWFDAEDLYGPLNIYKTIEKRNKKADNRIVMGPWTHGDWARVKGDQIISDVYFGSDISDFYQKEIEFPFFAHHLKGKTENPLPEAYLFDTGKKQWMKFDKWPSANTIKKKLYFQQDGMLSETKSKQGKDTYSEFISDPTNPVPHTEHPEVRFTPRPYMASDQRFASKREDVLVFQTDILTEDVTLAGELLAKLTVSTTGTDADWVVKLIDVYPEDFTQEKGKKDLGGYQQMVRSEIMRGRYRNSFSKPEPFTPEKRTEITLPLQDVLHTFKKGHRIMVQVQSTFFPLFDRNPQKYVENIFDAEESDFIKATHKVYHDEKGSYLEVSIVK
ncbi:CocE/NonD family hydrolase [Limibacter armeniacum]|uniref:CocE/NonD family hydrolase n=1 Tax=Limibacter armeniacum TaxID=466084 RepID=UPI002FE5D6B0